jgi:hypothetical protein
VAVARARVGSEVKVQVALASSRGGDSFTFPLVNRTECPEGVLEVVAEGTPKNARSGSCVPEPFHVLHILAGSCV